MTSWERCRVWVLIRLLEGSLQRTEAGPPLDLGARPSGRGLSGQDVVGHSGPGPRATPDTTGRRNQLAGFPARSPENAEIPATTYFPERLPSQYLRRWRA